MDQVSFLAYQIIDKVFDRLREFMSTSKIYKSYEFLLKKNPSVDRAIRKTMPIRTEIKILRTFFHHKTVAIHFRFIYVKVDFFPFRETNTLHIILLHHKIRHIKSLVFHEQTKKPS